MTDKLLPCPFCGDTSIHKDAHLAGEYFQCLGCGARGPLSTSEMPDWNTRHQPDTSTLADPLAQLSIDRELLQFLCACTKAWAAEYDFRHGMKGFDQTHKDAIAKADAILTKPATPAA